MILIHRKIQEDGTPQNKAAYRETVLFDQLYNILSEELRDKGKSPEYWKSLLSYEFNLYFQEFGLDKIESAEITEEQLVKLNKYIYLVNNIPANDFNKFIQSLVPHKSFNFDTASTSEYKNSTCNEEDLKDGFFLILQELVFAEKSITHSLFYWTSALGELFPTGIHHAERHLENIKRKILEASMDRNEELLFEKGRLVNMELDCDSIYSNIVVGRLALDDLDDSKISNFKKISLISLDKAKDIINE